ncbi:MAG TPA: HD domain-containing phosphohydrolase [Verrucomicrobiae bacterium]|nr:HD domain-containing phosphohydrolase [Verrucomicrobiae bacterium]
MNPARDTAPVLVVDDEPLIVLALGEILRQAGYEVVALSDPLAAMQQLKSNAFSVIITDQKMPGLSGLELLAEARRAQPMATRILITGVLDLDTVIHSINQGEIFRFIVKPWIREEFLATVSNARQRYELMRHTARLEEEAGMANAQLAEARKQLETTGKAFDTQTRQLEELRQTGLFEETLWLERAVGMLDTFCPRLGAQARCVTKVCQAISEVLKLDAEDRHTLESAARLYDVGLLALPRDLIATWQRPPHEIGEEQWAQIRQHPGRAEELLATDKRFARTGRIIRGHHERHDGRGYPDGLKGEEPEWLARLLAAAVSYASSDSPPAKAMQDLQAGAGTLFDPQAVRVLLSALPEAGLPARQREIAFKELVPGMILAHAIYSQNGLLLVPEGQRLNAAYIENLLAHHRAHPIGHSLTVYC